MNTHRVLDRKMWRDLWAMRGPVIAIAVVVACGVASFTAMRSMVYHLQESQRAYYASSRFADIFVTVKRAPRTILRSVADLAGVSAIEARVTGDVVLDVPGLAEPAVGHVVGMPTTRLAALDRVDLMSGRALTPGRADEVLLSEGFAKANRIRPGAFIGVVLNGRWQQLQVVGTATSPTYVYVVGPGDLFPDDRRYGILWMDDDAAAAAFGMRESWNDLSIARLAGTSEAELIRQLDRLFERYGTRGAYGRSLHVSHRFLSDEIEQNRTFATVIPAIFLGVATFLLNLVFSRLVAEQREQIGMLKAFGVPDSSLVRHFVLFALVPVLAGAIVGCAIGLWAAGKLAGLYAQYYRMPDAPFSPHPMVLLTAVGISIVAAVAGAVGGLRRILRLPAALAMRAEAPARYRAGLATRLHLDRLLSPVSRMTLRAMERRPWRAVLSVLGMALSVAVVMSGRFAWDSVGFIRDIQFEIAQREDVAVAFTVMRNRDALLELAHLPGVTRVEPLYNIPVRLQHAQRERQVSLTGVSPAMRLRQLVDDHGTLARLPERGVLLSRALGELLDVRIGDTLSVMTLVGERRTQPLVVGALLDDLVGVNAYVPASMIDRLAGSRDVIAGAVMRVDASARSAVYTRLKRTPGVAGVSARDAMLRNFDQTMSESFGVTLTTLVLFASALAGGVVYNMARIALSERGRELASLRVLGFTRAEVARMLLGEQALLTLLAMPLGFLIGAAFSWAMVVSLQSDLFRLPVIIRAPTYGLAALVLLLASAGSAILVRRRLDRFDLVSVLKTRE